MSLCCGGDGGAVILPLAEKVAAAGAPEGSLLTGNEVGGIAALGAPNGPLLAEGGLWRVRVGDLVSVWSEIRAFVERRLGRRGGGHN